MVFLKLVSQVVFALFLCCCLLRCSAEDGADNESSGEDKEEDQRRQEEDDRQAAQDMQEEMEKVHANDPKDPLQLASRTLERAFDRFQDGADEVPMFKLLSTVNRAAGEPRLLLLRIFELMDKNMDGRISNEEFTSLYMAPVAYPDKALELMFQLHDMDKNGYISQWEYLRFSLTVDGINQNIQDKWIEAGQKIKQQDVNGDGLVDLTEFTLFVVWQVNVGIHNQKLREEAKRRPVGATKDIKPPPPPAAAA